MHGVLTVRHFIILKQMNPKYEVIQDVRAQVKFLEELDKMEKKRHEEQEREMLLRAAKVGRSIIFPDRQPANLILYSFFPAQH